MGTLNRTVGILSLSVAAAAAACASPFVIEERPPPSSGALRPEATLFLAGDAGVLTPASRIVLRGLGVEIRAAASTVPHVALVYLGDNVYNEGIRREPRYRDARKLVYQLEVLQEIPENVSGYFIPGNHDWGDGQDYEEGRDRLGRQQAFVEQTPGVGFRPDAGCPGPHWAPLGPDVGLAFLDSEQLLRQRFDADCPYGTLDEVYDSLQVLLRESPERRTVVMAHHPLKTAGRHGGHRSQLVLPYYILAASGGVLQDLHSPRYASMRHAFAGVYADPDTPTPLFHVGGHDHSLQVFNATHPGEPLHLVSGATAKRSRIRDMDDLGYGTNRNGYMRVDFYADRARLRVMALPEENATATEVVYWCDIPYDAPVGACPRPPV